MGRRIRHNLHYRVCSGCCTGPAAPTDHICNPRPAGRGEWGWSDGAPGHYRPGPPPPAKTFFIAAILLWENDNVGIVLFYSVIYNSVVLCMFLTYSRGGHGHLFAYHLPAIELFYKQIKGFSRWSRTNLPTCFHILKNRLNEGFTVTACTVIAGGSAGAISPPSSLSVSISTTAYSGQTMCGGD